jgi:hypothetical protein
MNLDVAVWGNSVSNLPMCQIVDVNSSINGYEFLHIRQVYSASFLATSSFTWEIT